MVLRVKEGFFLIETATAFTVDVSLYHGDGFGYIVVTKPPRLPTPKGGSVYGTCPLKILLIWVLGMTAPKTNMEPKNDGFS